VTLGKILDFWDSISYLKNEDSKSSLEIFILLYFGSTGDELRALHLLGGYNTTWVTPPAPYCSSYFSGGISSLVGQSQSAIILSTASYIPGIIDTYLYA
jgi:hypothetical protein